MSKYKLCRGFKDLMPSDYKKHEYLKNAIEGVGNVYGYKMVKTSCIEESSLFNSCYNEGIEEKLFRISNRFTNEVSLNYDTTISILRSIVENKLYVDKSLPLKLMSLSEVYKYNRRNKDESSKYVYSFECVGDKSVYLDIENVLLSMKILNYINLNGYNLRINNFGEEDDYYLSFKHTLTNLGVTFEEDSSIVGKAYCTGIVYEIDVDDCDNVITGGRYDSVVDIIGGVCVGVVGTHIDFDKLISLCEKNEIFPSFKEEVDFYIIPKNENVFKYAIYVSELLRDIGAVVEIHYKEYDLKRLDDLLERIDVMYSVIIDEEDEIKETLKIRNSLNKKEHTVKLKDFIEDLEGLDDHHKEE